MLITKYELIMSIAENGPHGNHRGRLGNIVYYVLNGRNVSRQIGITTKPPTEAQLRTRLATKLSSKTLSRLLDFIRVGFSAAAIEAQDNPYNLAVKFNKKEIITGIYPDLKVAYDKLLVSQGPLNPAQNWTATQVADGLQFSWDTDPKMAWPEATDQVMMLAYFPKQEKAIYTLFGNSRLSGSDLLEIPPSLQSRYMETYISFVAIDRKTTANSIYTGNFNAETPIV